VCVCVWVGEREGEVLCRCVRLREREIKKNEREEREWRDRRERRERRERECGRERDVAHKMNRPI